MKVEEKISRIYIAEDGMKFSSKENCETHEMLMAWKKVGKSKQYVLQTPWGGFRKFSTVHNSRLKDNGATSNVKYAKKFSTFEKAWDYSNPTHYNSSKILTIEEANRISEENIAKAKVAKIKEQRYVCEYDRTPGVDGEYITNIGMVWYQNGAGWEEIPEFWMKKVNLTSR